MKINARITKSINNGKQALGHKSNAFLNMREIEEMC